MHRVSSSFLQSDVNWPLDCQDGLKRQDNAELDEDPIAEPIAILAGPLQLFVMNLAEHEYYDNAAFDAALAPLRWAI